MTSWAGKFWHEVWRNDGAFSLLPDCILPNIGLHQRRERRRVDRDKLNLNQVAGLTSSGLFSFLHLVLDASRDSSPQYIYYVYRTSRARHPLGPGGPIMTSGFGNIYIFSTGCMFFLYIRRVQRHSGIAPYNCSFGLLNCSFQGIGQGQPAKRSSLKTPLYISRLIIGFAVMSWLRHRH